MKLLEENALSLSGGVLSELMQSVLAKGSGFRFCARGESMAPFIRDCDTLTIAPLAKRAPRLGEVVAFSCPTEEGMNLVVHRVVGRRGRGFLVRGHGDDCVAEIVSSENMMGRVVQVERDGRHIRLGLGPERILIAWLGLARLLWISVSSIWREFRQLFKR